MSQIEAGKYKAKAKQWELGLTKGDNDQICVQFEIVEGDHAGRTLNWFGYFSDKTMKRTLEALRYCGWMGDDIDRLDGMGELTVEIVVEMKEQTEGKHAGKVFPEVRWVNQLGSGGPIKLEKPMDVGQRKMFAAKMRLHARTVPMITRADPKVDRVPGEDDE